MKVTVNNLLNAQEALKKLASAQVPAKTAYRMKRLFDVIIAELKRFDEVKNELVKKYADTQTEEEIKAKAPLRVTEKMEGFKQELTELLESEVELAAQQIDFSQIEKIELTVAELSALESFIKFEEEK